MSEQAPQINIPDIPDPSVDFDEFIQDIQAGEIPPKELGFRLNASNGVARDRNDRPVAKNTGNGKYFFPSLSSDAIKETRQVSDEQQEPLKRFAEIKSGLILEKARLGDVASFLQDIQAGEIPPKELGFRLNASNGVARDRNDRPVAKNTGNGKYFFPSLSSDAIKETRQVSDEQQEPLKRFAEIKSGLILEKARLGDVASFLQDIQAGEIPPKELGFRLNASNGVARDRNDRPVAKNTGNGKYFFPSLSSDAIKETRQVSDEQRTILELVSERSDSRKLQETSASKAISSSRRLYAGTSEDGLAESPPTTKRLIQLREQAKGMASGGQESADQIIRAVEDILASGNDEEALMVVEQIRLDGDLVMNQNASILEQLVQQARRIEIEGTFWEQVYENPQVTEARLNSYKLVDETDRQLINNLRLTLLQLRQENLLIKGLDGASREEPDYAATAMMLASAASIAEATQDQEAIDAIAPLVDLAYQNEANTIISEALSRLGLDQEANARLQEEIDNSPIRPKVAGVEFFSKFIEAKEKLEEAVEIFDNIALEMQVIEIREQFYADNDINSLVQEIVMLPADTEEDLALQQRLLDQVAFITAAKRSINPERFRQLQQLKEDGIVRAVSTELPTIDLEQSPEKRNIAALSNVTERFKTAILPLFEAVRGNGAKEEVAEYLKPAERDNLVQRIRKLEEQRELTDIERAYLESVELISSFNPHLVALATERPELTSLFLETYFDELDRQTKEQLFPDMYAPVIVIGLGPQGMAASGELNRSNPELAEGALYITADGQPGGPFGVPKGLSWELNSASGSGESTNVLPDLGPLDEAGKTVRSYSSPLVAFPGERLEGSDIRQGSINATVDWLPNPDNTTSTRYPTNVDEARILQLQAAMLVDSILKDTKVESVEPIDDGRPGNKLVTVSFQTPTGENITTRIRTDAIVVAGGLGERTFGFDVENSSAKDVLDEPIPEDGFPALTDTIGAFEVLSDPESKRPSAPEGTVVIYGGGNSADVLIEYFGRQFQSGNPELNKIKKVIVITNQPLSSRPRYAQINDLKSRNGQSNFLEVVSGRVEDVRRDGEKLIVVGGDGQPIKMNSGGEMIDISADHVIAATGFRGQLDRVFKPILADGESIDRRRGLPGVKLPNNPTFNLANELQNDSNVVIVGTAAQDDFKNTNKLQTLPDEAREALLRNGVENAVAIGFRAPDTRAATRIKFQDAKFSTSDFTRRRHAVEVAGINIDADRSEAVVSVDIDTLPRTRRDVPADSETLTALLLNSLPEITIKDDSESAKQGKRAKTTLAFTVEPDESGGFLIRSGESYPSEIYTAIQDAVSNPYFQAYALKAIKERRRSKGLDIFLTFSSGKLMRRDGGAKGDGGRTYVEAT